MHIRMLSTNKNTKVIIMSIHNISYQEKVKKYHQLRNISVPL